MIAMDQPVFSDHWGGTYRLIEPGRFTMGDTRGDGARNEQPAHDVEIERPFFMGERPVTQAQWFDVMGSNPSKFQEGWSAGLRPVESMTLDEVNHFLQRLNERDLEVVRLGFIGRWRLPSEAEWEYAAKAGTESRWWFGDRDRDLDDNGWHAGNSGGTTREVGSKSSNPWGLHDMNGLIYEWCEDHYTQRYDEPRKQAAFIALDGHRRVIRGGAWFTESDATRSTARSSAPPEKRSDGLGLRLVWEPEEPSSN